MYSIDQNYRFEYLYNFNTKEYINFILIKKYFCRNGKNVALQNWLTLFYLIKDFHLIFKFKYLLKTKELKAVFIPTEKRFLNKLFFFKLYLKLLNNIKWTTINIKKLFFFFKRTVALCIKELILTN